MAKPFSSQHTTSPSIRQDRTVRWFTASTISGKVQSLPLRVMSRMPTSSPGCPDRPGVAAANPHKLISRPRRGFSLAAPPLYIPRPDSAELVGALLT
jgi:hypothetical protein